VGGVLLHETFKPSYGLLGTTFGGNHLACAACLAVLDVIENEDLIANAANLGAYFKEKAAEIPQIKNVKGRGLMIGLEFDFEVAELRKKMIYDQHVFTGSAKNKKLLRFLPALNITKEHIDLFFEALKTVLK
jgi:acetylornithine aminotransferase